MAGRRRDVGNIPLFNDRARGVQSGARVDRLEKPRQQFSGHRRHGEPDRSGEVYCDVDDSERATGMSGYGENYRREPDAPLAIFLPCPPLSEWSPL